MKSCSSVIVMYGGVLCLPPFVLFIVLNFLAARRTLDTSNTKNIFTAFSGIFLPMSAFFARSGFKNIKENNKFEFKLFRFHI